jgi:NAD(P)-dependent dehydrogenase (short-subunit alcohol dehydrogenase family)
MEFSGKTAFVTGAANGIGLGICRALARNGVNIVLAEIERGAARNRAPRAIHVQRPHPRDQGGCFRYGRV